MGNILIHVSLLLRKLADFINPEGHNHAGPRPLTPDSPLFPLLPPSPRPPAFNTNVLNSVQNQEFDTEGRGSKRSGHTLRFRVKESSTVLCVCDLSCKCGVSQKPEEEKESDSEDLEMFLTL